MYNHSIKLLIGIYFSSILVAGSKTLNIKKQNEIARQITIIAVIVNGLPINKYTIIFVSP